MLPYKALISSVASTRLSVEEKAFIIEHQPWGFILFARNIDHEDKTQLGYLTNQLREITGRENVPIFVDQEGGRVQRLRPPLVAQYPAARRLGALYQHNKEAGMRAAFLLSRLHAFDLRRFGINANCLPLLDVPVAGSHDVIGERAYGEDAAMVAAMGEAAANGLLSGGVLPVMKHIPGHGRARCDTHLALARVGESLDVLQAHDFMPFRYLRHLPVAMSAHIVYEKIDKTQPATLSKKVIGEIIRGVIGFEGLLISDDLSMQALNGTLSERARAAFAAGCDVVLYCHGILAEMHEVAESTPFADAFVSARMRVAQGCITPQNGKDKIGGEDEDERALRAEFSSLLM